MDNIYPRIYSLSTIEIKQHFNCDYLFHPKRTDFSGESGSGKSMVADMIQLILVGSTAYKSSTKSNKIRDPKGMVLQSKGQYSVGYIFLNIEVQFGKYLVIGCYIESSHNKVASFIIQSGYDWQENLTPLDQPIFHKSLLDNGKSVQLETLIDISQFFNIKVLNRKDYHKLLYKNELLALDLNKGKTLENYASILRSFSRGKGFETDSESLKKFLFGNDDHIQLQSKFEEEIKAINNDHHEHSRYQEEIALINSKQKSIEKVVKLSKAYNELKRTYLSDSILFWDRITSNLKKEYDEVKREYSISQIKLSHVELCELELEINEVVKLKQSLDHDSYRVRELIAKKASSQNEYQETEQYYQLLKARYESISKVEEWLDEVGGNVSDLEKWYQSQKQKLQNLELLKDFVAYLNSEDLENTFKESLWAQDFKSALDDHNRQVEEIENELDSLLSLNKFSNLDNPDSLAKWAVSNLDFPLSNEQESLLIHFQSFPRRVESSDILRYLKYPDQLFEAPDLEDKTKAGFWINLRGVSEFIEMVPQQFLNTDNPEDIVKKLKHLQIDLLEQISQKENQLASLIDFKERLNQFANLHLVIPLYESKELILNEEISGISRLSNDDLKDHIKSYSNKDQIKRDFEDIEKKHQVTMKLFFGNDGEIDRLEQSVRDKKKSLNSILLNRELDDYTIERRKQITNKSLSLEEIELNSGLNPSAIQKIKDNLAASYKNNLVLLGRIKSDIRINDLEHQNNLESVSKKLDEAKGKLKSSNDKYFLEYQEEFQVDSTTKEVNEDPEISLSTEYIRAKEAFRSAYDSAADNLENKNQLSDYRVGALAHKLLPTVFITSKVEENIISDRIADRLLKLTRDVQEIGSRKVEILKRVLTEVYNKYNEYLEVIQRIDHYLKNKNRTITGGNRASLVSKPAVGFPINWMSPFRKQLSIELNNTGLFESLKKEIDIHKMMIQAFQNARGNQKVTPEELLDPKSYFDLDFELQLDTGASNAGSQGQTYTANALLGLARLSLIKDENRRGIRIMPIDEAEGLGGNYNMLNRLAKDENFQILSMSIETAGEIESGEQFIYIMNENNVADVESYVPPLGIFSDGELQVDLEEHIMNESQESE